MAVNVLPRGRAVASKPLLALAGEDQPSRYVSITLGQESPKPMEVLHVWEGREGRVG